MVGGGGEEKKNKRCLVARRKTKLEMKREREKVKEAAGARMDGRRVFAKNRTIGPPSKMRKKYNFLKKCNVRTK